MNDDIDQSLIQSTNFKVMPWTNGESVKIPQEPWKNETESNQNADFRHKGVHFLLGYYGIYLSLIGIGIERHWFTQDSCYSIVRPLTIPSSSRNKQHLIKIYISYASLLIAKKNTQKKSSLVCINCYCKRTRWWNDAFFWLYSHTWFLEEGNSEATSE